MKFDIGMRVKCSNGCVGDIENFDSSDETYKVIFDDGDWGWYSERELSLEEPNSTTNPFIDFVDALKVQFLKPIFEDDFPDRGMTAWLTDITWEKREDCFKLYFDFSDFEEINDKYFKEEYYSNKFTRYIEESTGRKLFTALETGNYSPKYSVYFSIPDNSPDRNKLAQDLLEYLRVVK